YRDTPYARGGSLQTGNATDCSGFVQYIYKGFKINLPSSSAEQVDGLHLAQRGLGARGARVRDLTPEAVGAKGPVPVANEFATIVIDRDSARRRALGAVRGIHRGSGRSGGALRDTQDGAWHDSRIGGREIDGGRPRGWRRRQGEVRGTLVAAHREACAPRKVDLRLVGTGAPDRDRVKCAHDRCLAVELDRVAEVVVAPLQLHDLPRWAVLNGGVEIGGWDRRRTRTLRCDGCADLCSGGRCPGVGRSFPVRKHGG
ncbi:MAG: NlpC/P60 family protein, partial [Polyangia bacterium]